MTETRQEMLDRIERVMTQLRPLITELVGVLDVLAGEADAAVSVDELEIGVRAQGALKNNGITTIRQLRQISDTQLLRTPNFGRVSLDEVRGALKAYDNGR
jgi:DNA-directed RNA polymerase alpha subunit